MILLDTNVVSELWRLRPSQVVLAWLNAQDNKSLFICAPVLAELHFGAERLPTGPRRDFLQAMIGQVETTGFKDRILPFDNVAAAAFGRISAQRQRAGRRMEPIDAMIAAIAVGRGMTLATRDVSGFADIDLDVIDPFAAIVDR